MGTRANRDLLLLSKKRLRLGKQSPELFHTEAKSARPTSGPSAFGFRNLGTAVKLFVNGPS